MRKIWLSAALFVSVSGCSALGVRHGINVDAAAVRAYMADSCTVPPAGLNYSPYDFYVAGVGEARRQCTVFLDRLTNLNRDARFLDSTIATANSQTAVILGVTAPHSTKAVAVVAAATEFVRKVISSFTEEYAFASYAHDIAPKIAEVMNAFLINEKTDDARKALPRDVAVSTPADYCAAADLVRSFASICSPTSIDALLRGAIHNAAVIETGVSAQPTPLPRASLLPQTRFARRVARSATRRRPASVLVEEKTVVTPLPQHPLSRPTFTLGSP